MYDLEVILSTAGILIVYYTYVQSMCVCICTYIPMSTYVDTCVCTVHIATYTCTFT